MTEAFARALLDPDLPVPPGLRAWNGSEPTARFAVYRNNVMVSLIEALADTFPVVAQLVGEAFFRAMAREFAMRQPPSSPVLAHYGQAFAGFVAGFDPAASVPYLADVARLEYAYVEAFHAADAAALGADDLARELAAPEGLACARLRFHPTVRLVRSPYAVVSIWAAHQGQGELGAVDPQQAEAALVTRPEMAVEVLPLAPAAAAFLGELLDGRTLGEALERTHAAHPGFEPAPVFSLLISARALTALTH